MKPISIAGRIHTFRTQTKTKIGWKSRWNIDVIRVILSIVDDKIGIQFVSEIIKSSYVC